MNRKSLVIALGALAMVAFAATAFAQVRTVRGVTVKRVTPIKTVPMRTLQNSNLPPLMRLIVGNRNYSAAQLSKLRQKLITSGALRPAGQKFTVPLLHKRPAMLHAPVVRDRDLQTAIRAPTSRTFIVPAANFVGLGEAGGDSIACAPPDTDMAAGQNYVVEIVNCAGGFGQGTFAVFDKTGARILGPIALGNLWTSGVCATNGFGDNVVLYDQFAHRWIISQFAGSSRPTDECVAASQTGDPTGAYYVYDFPVYPNDFADYPKLAVWPDAYYASFNVFNASGTAFVGAGFVAFERTAMLQGLTARMVRFTGNGNDLAYSILPADVDGPTPPPAGSPGIFVDYVSPSLWGVPFYALEMWRMSVDWANPANSTLTGPTQITVNPFNDGICSYARACIPEPSPATPSDYLDSLGDRLMFRLAYRNLANAATPHQALVVNQTVGTAALSSATVTPPAGIRWYELDAPAGATSATAWTVAQQGTYLPSDGASRWMGSIAMDHDGDMALGYSLSSTSIAPAVAYTGRLASDPAGQMTQTETRLVTGGGVQMGSGNRWGDYSSMVVDPSDDCTFWYAQEYYAATGSFAWSTHIGAFKFANCTPIATGTLSGTVTSAASGSAAAGAQVVIQPGYVDVKTDSSGHYSVQLTAGNYTAEALNYPNSSTAASVTVTGGQTTTQDLSLQAAPKATISGVVQDGGFGNGVSAHGWGLYADVGISAAFYGKVGDVFTDPVTGDYDAQLPEGFQYQLAATAHSGYRAASPIVGPLTTGNLTKNILLTVDSACDVPGYGNVFGETFNGPFFPPSGWTVTNDYSGSPIVWSLNDTYADRNYTGGSGNAATADSNNGAFVYNYYGSYDTSLVTPPIAVSSLPAQPMLTFDLNYQSINDSLDVDINPDGSGWVNMAHLTSNYGALYSLPGATYSIDLNPYVSGANKFQIRWRYYDLTSGYDWYAQVDNVGIGSCQMQPGGLVVGEVTNADTGAAINGAAVYDDVGDGTTSFDTSPDPNLKNLYILFAPSGKRVVTAAGDYMFGTTKVGVSDNAVTRQDFSLGNADLEATSFSGPSTIDSGANAKLILTLTNAGPSTATGVAAALQLGNDILGIQSATASQGSCTMNSGKASCSLGTLISGSTATVTLTVTGANAGQGVVTALVTANEPDPAPSNNAAQVKVTVKQPPPPPSNGGGGGFAGLGFAALLGLALTGAWFRRRRGA